MAKRKSHKLAADFWCGSALDAYEEGLRNKEYGGFEQSKRMRSVRTLGATDHRFDEMLVRAMNVFACVPTSHLIYSEADHIDDVICLDRLVAPA